MATSIKTQESAFKDVAFLKSIGQCTDKDLMRLKNINYYLDEIEESLKTAIA